MYGELSDLDPRRRTLLERLHANSGVDTRHTVLPLAEYGLLDGFGPTNDLYIDRATALGEQAMRGALLDAGMDASELDLLIVTSVTGLAVPSLDARLIPRLGLRADIKRMPIFGLGCVAGAAGLARLHDYLLAWPQHTAALLAVELCSLTVPTANATTADLVVSGLFGDGAAALAARGQQAATASGGPQVIATRSEVYPDSADVLAWRQTSEGFRIVLTADLADVVAKHLGASVSDFLRQHGLSASDIESWVCHPGGPKVIDAYETIFGADFPGAAEARRSLREFGNMSAVSVLFVLDAMLASARSANENWGRALLTALGPGFSAGFVVLGEP